MGANDLQRSSAGVIQRLEAICRANGGTGDGCCVHSEAATLLAELLTNLKTMAAAELAGQQELAWLRVKKQRAVQALIYMARFWKDKPSGGYALSALEDILQDDEYMALFREIRR